MARSYSRWPVGLLSLVMMLVCSIKDVQGAATTSITPTCSGWRSDTGSGGGAPLNVGKWDVPLSLTDVTYRGFAWFDIPAGIRDNIESATLTVQVNDLSAWNSLLYEVDLSDLGTTTWADFVALGTTYAQYAALGGGYYHDCASKAATLSFTLQTSRLNGKSTIGFAFRAYPETTPSTAGDDSNNIVLSNPTLIIKYTHTVNAPNAPSGPSSGETGQSLTFSTGGSTCNLGHSVQYQFDWGDGQLSNWGSSTQAHTYASSVNSPYSVCARARCTSDTWVVSGWSSGKSVTINCPPVTMTVQSENPNSGVSISVSPNDNNGMGNGTTTFTRTYYGGTYVTLTAPATAAGGSVFQEWLVDDMGFSGNTNPSILVYLVWACTYKAVYAVPQIQTSTTSLSVPEGSTATFQVKLTARPSGNVTVSVQRASGDSDITVSGGSSRTFTTSNWNTYQTVTLSAGEDADATNGQAIIRCSATGMTSVDVTATEADNGGGANQPPVVDSSPWADSYTITLPTNTTQVHVVAHDPDSGPQALTYTWSKVSGAGSVTFGASNGTTTGYDCTATFGSADAYVLRVTVSDGADSTPSDTPTITVQSSGSGPDLVVTSFTASPNPALPGDTVTFTITIHNQGDTDAGLFYFDLWSDRSTEPTQGETSTIWNGFNSLAAGASGTWTFWVDNVTAGSYQAWVYVDSGTNRVSESNEDNNTASCPWDVGTGSGPDLVVSSFTASPNAASPGDSVDFTITVLNQGDTDAEYFFLSLWSDRATAPTQADVDYTLWSVSGSLGAGNSRTFVFTVDSLAAGSYQAWVYADHDPDQVSETNESNNTASVSYTVGTNTPPTISNVPNQVTTVNTQKSVQFTVGDAETPAEELENYVVAVDKPELLAFVAFQNLGGGSRKVVVMPGPDAQGAVTIIIGVRDGGGLTACDSFVLTIKQPSSGGGGGGGGGCSLAAGPAGAAGWLLPYLALGGVWLLSRRRRRGK